METVWFVEQGHYSEYSVLGVFTTKENAQYIVDKINIGTRRTDPATIREVPLDPMVNQLRQGLTLFWVYMQHDGTVRNVKTVEGVTNGIYVGELNIIHTNELVVYVYASDATHAIKIVNEHRTNLIASGEWDRQFKATLTNE